MRLQGQHHTSHKQTVQRRVDIALGDDASASEKARIVEECIAEGHSVFLQALQGGSVFKAHQALEDVQARHNELVSLERNVSQLAKLFEELALLVDAQGETLDGIEQLVSNAKAYTGQGADELIRANRCVLCCSEHSFCCEEQRCSPVLT